MNEFNSQVCTSVEQSKRLLAMGLKPETADMSYYSLTGEVVLTVGIAKVSQEIIKGGKVVDVKHAEIIPAWSLHRLIEMCNKTQLTICIYNNEVTVDGYLFEVFDNTYDNLILVIEFLIKVGQFDKEYFKQ